MLKDSSLLCESVDYRNTTCVLTAVSFVQYGMRFHFTLFSLDEVIGNSKITTAYNKNSGLDKFQY